MHEKDILAISDSLAPCVVNLTVVGGCLNIGPLPDLLELINYLMVILSLLLGLFLLLVVVLTVLLFFNISFVVVEFLVLFMSLKIEFGPTISLVDIMLCYI